MQDSFVRMLARRLKIPRARVDICSMECPKCRSTLLMIRQKTGVERIRCFFTGLRLYRCLECDAKFRAADRRRFPREEADAAGMQAGLARRRV